MKMVLLLLFVLFMGWFCKGAPFGMEEEGDSLGEELMFWSFLFREVVVVVAIAGSLQSSTVV